MRGGVLFTRTLSAYTLDDVIDGSRLIAIGKGKVIDCWSLDVVEAEGTVALLAVEMDVTVVLLLMVGAVTQFVSRAGRPIVYYVDNIMVAEKSQSTEDS